jgi:hypothetical protein
MTAEDAPNPNRESATEDAPKYPEPATEWATLPAAAKAAGVSVSALRKWYGAGEIPSRMAPGPTGPRREVPLAAVLARARRRAAPPGPRTGPVPEGLSLVPASLFADLQAAYLTAQERALDAEVRARVAEHKLTRAEEEAARLRGELDQARRPWWRRTPRRVQP